MNIAVYEKLISCSYDVRHHVDCVIKRDFYMRKFIHVLKISMVYRLCSKNICGISCFVLKTSVIYQGKNS